MTDSVSGVELDPVSTAVSKQQIGPCNLGLYLREVPRNLRVGVKTVHQCSILSGSIYDGTCDAAVGARTNTSKRQFDCDWMLIRVFLIGNQPEYNLFIQDVEDRPGYVHVFSKITAGDTGPMSEFVFEQNGNRYLSSSTFKKLATSNCGDLGPNTKMSTTTNYFSASIPFSTKSVDQFSIDNVPSLACPGWPDIASPWIYRPRYWPTPETILRCISSGHHLVPKAYHGKDPDIQWRYSFSLAESILMDSLNDIQWKCYYICKTLLHFHVHIEGVISTYHLKTVLFYACEKVPSIFWVSTNLAVMMLGLFDRLIHAFAEKYLKHYFIEKINLLADANEGSVKGVLHQLVLLRSKITMKSFLKEFRCPHFWLCQFYRYQFLLYPRLNHVVGEKYEINTSTAAGYLFEIQPRVLDIVKEIQIIAEIMLNKSKKLPACTHDILLAQASMLHTIGIFLLQKCGMLIGADMARLHFTRKCPETVDKVGKVVQLLSSDVTQLVYMSRIHCEKLLKDKSHPADTKELWELLIQGQTYEEELLTQHVLPKASLENLLAALPELLNITEFLLKDQMKESRWGKLFYIRQVLIMMDPRQQFTPLDTSLLMISSEDEQEFHNYLELDKDGSAAALLKTYKNINIIMASFINNKDIGEEGCLVYDCNGIQKHPKKPKDSTKTPLLIDFLRFVLLHVEFKNLHESQELDNIPNFDSVHPCVIQDCVYCWFAEKCVIYPFSISSASKDSTD